MTSVETSEEVADQTTYRRELESPTTTPPALSRSVGRSGIEILERA